MLLAVVAAWRFTPLGEWVDVAHLSALARGAARRPLAPLFVLAGYVLAGLLLVPLNPLILATAIAFDPLPASLYALGGSLLSAAVGYAVGARLARATVRRLAGARLDRIHRVLGERGVLAVALVRTLPLAPFSIVNFVAGAAGIRFRDYLLGTALGIVPGIAVIVLFGDQLVRVAHRPSWLGVALLVVLVLLSVLGISWARRRFGAD